MALRHSLDDLVLKVLDAAPLPDAVEAVDVAAARQDAEAAIRGRDLVVHHLHADAAHLVPAELLREGLLHVYLERQHAHLRRHTGNDPYVPVMHPCVWVTGD